MALKITHREMDDVAVLALEAGKTLLLEMEKCAEQAERQKISVTTVG